MPIGYNLPMNSQKSKRRSSLTASTIHHHFSSFFLHFRFVLSHDKTWLYQKSFLTVAKTEQRQEGLTQYWKRKGKSRKLDGLNLFLLHKGISEDAGSGTLRIKHTYLV